MSDEKKGEKEYEPPEVKEIGGVFEQAMGVSNCLAGGIFRPGCTGGGRFDKPCSRGLAPSYSCLNGALDQQNVCWKGSGVTGDAKKG